MAAIAVPKFATTQKDRITVYASMATSCMMTDSHVQVCITVSLHKYKVYLIQPFLLSDIEECVTGVDLCDQNCHNSNGSYLCSCNSGYRLGDDGFRCGGIHIKFKSITIAITVIFWA